MLAKAMHNELYLINLLVSQKLKAVSSMLVSRVFSEIGKGRKIAAISMSEKTWPN
jgi:hypothetical protein